MLGTLHNLTFYQRLMEGIRRAIEEGRLESYRRDFLQRYLSNEGKVD